MDKPQQILTNSVRFRFLNECDLFSKYAVTFIPELPSALRRSLVIQQFHRALGKLYLFDDLRNVLYLPVGGIETIVSNISVVSKNKEVSRLSGRIPYFEDRKIEVEFRRIPVSASPLSEHTRSFLTVLLRRGFELLSLTKFGDGVYDTKVQLEQFQIDIQSGIRFGTREIEHSPMLWMEVSSLVTRTKSLLDVLLSVSDREDHTAIFNKLVISKMARTPTRTKAFYPVHGVRWDLNPLSYFLYNEQQVRLVDFYREQYGIEINDLSQPLLITKCGAAAMKGKNNLYECRQPMIVAGDQNFLVHIPELCYTCDILKESKYDTEMSNEILKYVNPSPQKMASILKSYLNIIHGSPKVLDLFRRWNIELDESFVQVVGNILPGPRIRMNASTTLDFSQTERFQPLEEQLKFWKLARCTPFYSCVPLLTWLLVCTTADKPLAVKFAETFVTESAKLGLEYVGVKSIYTLLEVDCNKDFFASNCLNAIREAGMNVQLVVFILPRSGSAGMYQAIKKICTVELGIPSQGILAKTFTRKGFVGIVRAIAMQVCTKLGGAPWALDFSAVEEAIMTVGIDAYHSRTRLCSVYAAIFTLNSQCTKYYTRTVRQNPGVETCDTLGPMFFDAYVEFYKENGRWPSKVVVFRDGVSNAYLNLIRDHEVAQMKRSLEFLTPRPKLIVVLVQKYTTDRLMLLHGESILNPMPGTVIDNGITRTEYQDFFMFSQMSRGKVSVQPTRCVVLEGEETDFEFIKKATYAYSFNYFNWPGSIRIPAVCQYAHKAAGFVGNVLKEAPSELLNKKLFYL